MKLTDRWVFLFKNNINRILLEKYLRLNRMILKMGLGGSLITHNLYFIFYDYNL